jgi:hypothetical protein
MHVYFRYLLSKGFARLNKWFVLPVNDQLDVKVPNFSFNFNFFLHGDNKVCASVDVQRHRYIYNLTNKDFDKTSPLNGKILLFEKKIHLQKKPFFFQSFWHLMESMECLLVMLVEILI